MGTLCNSPFCLGSELPDNQVLNPSGAFVHKGQHHLHHKRCQRAW